MGVRFACHHCGKPLNIKIELAGKRAVCPACSGKIRIPLEDAETSLPVEAKPTRTSAADEALEPAHQEATKSQKLLGSTTADADPTLESAGQKSAPIEATAQKIGSQVLAPSPNHIEKVLQEFDATASWYVRPPGGGQYGPANAETFGQWIQEGRVAASSLVWRDGWSQWRTATEAFPDISAQLPGAAEDLSLGGFDTQAASSAKALREKSTGDSAIANQKVAGENDLGKQARGRSLRRSVLIVILLIVAVSLAGALYFVANR